MTPTTPPIPDQGALRFVQPRGAGRIVSDTLALAREAAGPLVRGYLAIGAPAALAAGIAMTLFLRAAAPLLEPGADLAPDAVGGTMSTTYAGAMLLSFLATATVLALGAAVVRRYREGAPAEVLTVGALWDETRGLLMSALSMVLVVGGGAMLASLLAGAAGAGALLWLTLMLWATPYVAVAFAVRMLEGGTLGTAFARARTLVRGRWAATTGGLLLAVLVAGVAAMLLSLPLVVLVAGATGEPPATTAQAVEALGWVLGPVQVVSSGLYLLPVLAAFLAHGALVAREAAPAETAGG